MNETRRRAFLGKLGSGFLSVALLGYQSLLSFFGKVQRAEQTVFFTTGFKVAEVTTNSVTIWTRLCGQETPNPIVHERIDEVFRHPINFNEGQEVETMDGGVKSAPGWVKVHLVGSDHTYRSEWIEAVADNDHTVTIPFTGLRAGEQYHMEIEGRSSPFGNVNRVSGTFHTVPEPESEVPVHLVTSTCQYFWSFDDKERGFRNYDSMRKLKPDLYIQTGDYIYYDKPGPLARSKVNARHKWRAMDSRLSIRDLYTEVPVYMIKDDHDLLKDDVYPGSGPYGKLSFEDGLSLWHENTGLKDKPYRNLRWGKDLEIWMVEGREFRSRNDMEDGPSKSIWGKEQKAWFRETAEASDATFKVLFSATPVVGPDRNNKKDNHANQTFKTEGDWLRGYLSQHGFYVVNGDRHWQYVSKDAVTGLMEFGSGAVSDNHAQGWNPDDKRPEHRFLRVKGGFLGIQVNRSGGDPQITFTHYDVDGQEVHVEVFSG